MADNTGDKINCTSQSLQRFVTKPLKGRALCTLCLMQDKLSL